MFGLGKKKELKRQIVINAEALETRVAVMENGRLEEYQVEHPTEDRIVGSVFKGRIQNLEHDLQAAFVDIGMKKNAFLHYWDMIPEDGNHPDVDSGNNTNNRRRRTSKRKRYTNSDIEKRFPPGSEIVVQVTKGPIGTKGPRVSASISIPGRYLVMMPGVSTTGVSRKIADVSERNRLRKILNRLVLPENTGLIIRTVSAGASKRAFVRDLRGLMLSWEEMQTGINERKAPCCVYAEPDLVERVVRDWLTEEVDRIVIDSKEKYERINEVAGRISRRVRSRVQHYQGALPIFEHYEVERQLDEALRRKVDLQCGGYLVLDETEALIAIDVNTGRHKGVGSQDQAIFEVNSEAVEEVARQLRLRNIGGLVVVDLIDMKSRKHQNAVYRDMRAALRRDRARTNVLPISELGLLQMTRQRAEAGIMSSLYVDCPYCHGRGSVKSPLAMSVDIQRQVSAVLRKHSKSAEHADLQVVVHPRVLQRLRDEDEAVLVALENKFAGTLSFRADPSKHVEFFAVKDGQTGDVLYSTPDV
ncbi:MAG: Rne/Rng family ribonuclease [Kiritimatiellae bacterium]|nr:Rne/Rng family ribonuclease [Kiritimatiellia bacterium]